MAGIRAGHIVTQADLNNGLGVIIRKSLDEGITSNVTLQDDDELFFPVVGGIDYMFDGHILYTAGSGVNLAGLKCTFTLPASSTGKWSAYGPNVATSPPVDYDATANDFGTTRSMGGNGASAFMALAPRGSFTAGGNGFLNFRFAQHASSVTATTIRAGSTLRLQKVI